MPQSTTLSEPYRTQSAYAEADHQDDRALVHAIDLHKAKFDQAKAYEEYQNPELVFDRLPTHVYDRSRAATAARQNETLPVSPTNAWESIASGESWIGSLPVHLARRREDVLLRGYPYLIAFDEGVPQVICNMILPSKAENMQYVYANEWARPWAIAKILDATGFDCDDTVLVTMKARESEVEPVLDAADIGGQLYRTAQRTVDEARGSIDDLELTSGETHTPAYDHEAPHILSEVTPYAPDFYRHLGHGESVRDVLQMLLGNRDLISETPPDRGLSLSYALRKRGIISDS